MMKTEQKPAIRALLLIACLFFLPFRAEAHKIHVFAWISGDTVTVESNFSKNRPLIRGKVTVQDSKTHEVLLQGTGDEKGIFTFTVPAVAKAQESDLLIVVSGSEGHQSEWLLPATEYLSDSSPPSNTPPHPENTTQLNSAELQSMLQELLEQELAPIKRSLAENRQGKPGFRDIIGGIGYLLGLAGLVAWMKNRTPRNDKSDA